MRILLIEDDQRLLDTLTSQLREAGYATPFTPLEDGVRRYIQDYPVKA